MWDLLTGRTMQRLVVLSTIFWILTTLDLHWDDTRWWAVFVLLLVFEYISGVEGEMRGTNNMLSMSRDKLISLKDFMDSVGAGNVHSIDELNKILKKDDTENE